MRHSLLFTRGFRLFPISRDPPEGGTLLMSLLIDWIDMIQFPISRDPPEGGTVEGLSVTSGDAQCFQFLGIPPKGELPPGELPIRHTSQKGFPISRDPPEGGTARCMAFRRTLACCFQFLGIPPKGEH